MYTRRMFLILLSPRKSRNLHICKGNQQICCSEIWCESCFIQHLINEHSPQTLFVFNKFRNLTYLISANKGFISQEEIQNKIQKKLELKQNKLVEKILKEFTQENYLTLLELFKRSLEP